MLNVVKHLLVRSGDSSLRSEWQIQEIFLKNQYVNRNILEISYLWDILKERGNDLATVAISAIYSILLHQLQCKGSIFSLNSKNVCPFIYYKPLGLQTSAWAIFYHTNPLSLCYFRLFVLLVGIAWNTPFSSVFILPYRKVSLLIG